MEVKFMKIENNYPDIKKKVNKFLIFRKIMLIIFLIASVVSIIVNLAVGGKKWMFYVMGGEAIGYFAILYNPLIDNTLLNRITVLMFIICAYLYLIDWIEKTSFSYFVISILSFSIILIQILIFFLEFRNQKKRFIPIFLTALGSIIFCLLAIIKVVELNWAIIVLGSLGLAVLIMLFSFYFKDITSEIKKYFSLR